MNAFLHAEIWKQTIVSKTKHDGGKSQILSNFGLVPYHLYQFFNTVVVPVISVRFQETSCSRSVLMQSIEETSTGLKKN